MRQAKLISIAAVLIVGLAGCGGEQTPPDTADSTPTNSDTVKTDDPSEETGEAVAIGSATVNADGTPTEEGDGTFSDPTVAGGPPVGAVPLDLITSTNPDTRAQQVQRDRPDPFSLLPASPTVEVRPSSTPSGATGTQTAALPGSGASGSGAGSATAGRSSAGGASSGTTTGSTNGNGAASDGSAPDVVVGPPPPPPTTLARGVTVSGVVRIGAVPYAIVQAPNEASSRYVRAGQSLSNGAVLVKRIDASSFEPVVVLEQNGVEVVRNVEGRPVEESEEDVADADDETAIAS